MHSNRLNFEINSTLYIFYQANSTFSSLRLDVYSYDSSVESYLLSALDSIL